MDKCPSNVLDALCDDLNTSKALAEIIEISKKLSSWIQNQNKVSKKNETIL